MSKQITVLGRDASSLWANIEAEKSNNNPTNLPFFFSLHPSRDTLAYWFCNGYYYEGKHRTFLKNSPILQTTILLVFIIGRWGHLLANTNIGVVEFPSFPLEPPI